MSRSSGYAAAAAYCHEAAQLDGDAVDPELMLLASQYQWVAQDYPRSARFALLALIAGGDAIECRDMACTALASAGDWSACVIAGKCLIADHPDAANGYRWLALAHEAMGQSDTALDFAAEALERDPSDETMRATLVRGINARGLLRHADGLLREGLALNPASAQLGRLAAELASAVKSPGSAAAA